MTCLLSNLITCPLNVMQHNHNLAQVNNGEYRVTHTAKGPSPLFVINIIEKLAENKTDTAPTVETAAQSVQLCCCIRTFVL